MGQRDKLDVPRLLDALGIKHVRRGVMLKATCPNPEHDDKSPSWTIVDSPGSPKHGGHNCFSCGFGGGPWELVSAVRGVDLETAAAFVHSFVTGAPRAFSGVPRVIVRERPRLAEYALPSGVKIPSVDGSAWPDAFAEYLAARGVTPEQIERWHIGYATRGRLAWRVVIPVHTRGRLVAYVARAIFADRERYDMPTVRMGASPAAAVFGEPLLEPSLSTLTIAEGCFSMLALERAGAPNPVALLGSDWSVEKAAALSLTEWRRVLIATDPDAAGDRVARAIGSSFRKIEIRRVRLDRSPDDCRLVELRDAIHAAMA